MNHHVHRRHPRKDHRARELAEPTLEQVPIDRGLAVLRDYEADPWMPGTRKGSAHPNVEMFGAKSLPCSRDHA